MKTSILTAFLAKTSITPPEISQRFDNNLTALLLTDLDSTTTSFNLTPQTGGWPVSLVANEYMFLTLTDHLGRFEIVRVTAISGTTFTVSRGQENTNAETWTAATTLVSARLTADTLERLPLLNQTNRFTQPQSFELGAVFHDDLRLAAGMSLGSGVSPDFSLQATGSAVSLVSGAMPMDLESEQLSLNAVGWPLEPSLVRGQYLFVGDTDQIEGRPFEWYIGAYALAPSAMPSGDPLQPGMRYYDLVSMRVKVWTGLTWRDMEVPGTGWLFELRYAATGSQDTFVFSTPDVNGNSFTMDTLAPETLLIFVEGLLMAEDVGFGGDYTVDEISNEIVFSTPLAGGELVQVEFFIAPEKLSPSGINTVLLKAWVLDGVEDTFDLQRASDDSVISVTGPQELALWVDGVRMQPGVDYTTAGDEVTFTDVPRDDSIVWGMYYSPVLGGGGGGSGNVLGVVPAQANNLVGIAIDGLQLVDSGVDPTEVAIGVVPAQANNLVGIEIGGTQLVDSGVDPAEIVQSMADILAYYAATITAGSGGDYTEMLDQWAEIGAAQTWLSDGEGVYKSGGVLVGQTAVSLVYGVLADIVPGTTEKLVSPELLKDYRVSTSAVSLSSGDLALDLSASSRVFTITISGAFDLIAPTNLTEAHIGMEYILRVTSGATPPVMSVSGGWTFGDAAEVYLSETENDVTDVLLRIVDVTGTTLTSGWVLSTGVSF